MLTSTPLHGRFLAVFVCTGNRARSPLAAAFFRQHAGGIPSEAISVGTMRLENQPALGAAVRAGRRLGVDVSGHTSRTLSRAELSVADVVLGFEPEHVSMAVIEGGSAIERTFLLGELVALLAHGGDGSDEPRARARAALALADSQRVRSRPNPRYAVPDPIGMSDRDVERIASSIDELVRVLVRGLFGGAGHRPVSGGRA